MANMGQRVERLGSAVVAFCQQKATESGHKTYDWQVDATPYQLGEDEEGNPQVEPLFFAPPSSAWLLRVSVKFVCPCGRTQRLLSIQHLSFELLDSLLSSGGAEIVAENTASNILYEFQKHIDGEADSH